jgi:phosphonate transport system substrate-binding protein
MSLAFALWRNGLLACLCWLLWGTSAHAQAAVHKASEYIVSITPVMPPSEMKRRWQPLLNQLAHDTGFGFHLQFYQDNTAFEEGLVRDEADIVVLSPLQSLRLNAHYRPQLHTSTPIVGMVVVRKDSPLKQLSDLREHSLSLQSGSNLSATILIQQTLKEKKIEPALKFSNSEGNALHSVLLNKTDAAIINNYLLLFMSAGIASQVSVIHRTAELPSPAISTNLHMPADSVKKLKIAMLQLNSTHPELLRAIQMPDISEDDPQSDYAITGALFPAEIHHAGH